MRRRRAAVWKGAGVARATWQRIRDSSSTLSADAVRAMEALPWFAALPPAGRSQVGLVLHASLDLFAEWLRKPSTAVPAGPEVFGAAPRELARSVNLKQTVQLIRVAVGVVEAAVPKLAATGDEQVLREAVLRYSREIAFAAADVYAAAAEARGCRAQQRGCCATTRPASVTATDSKSATTSTRRPTAVGCTE
jgi:hypothetical protein